MPEWHYIYTASLPIYAVKEYVFVQHIAKICNGIFVPICHANILQLKVVEIIITSSNIQFRKGKNA